jgi:hypothetical protein
MAKPSLVRFSTMQVTPLKSGAMTFRIPDEAPSELTRMT